MHWLLWILAFLWSCSTHRRVAESTAGTTPREASTGTTTGSDSSTAGTDGTTGASPSVVSVCCAKGYVCDEASTTCVAVPVPPDPASCVQDGDCRADKVCAAGACVLACSATNACPAGHLCCGGRCTSEIANDSCGKCGVKCTSAQHCVAGSCVTQNFGQLLCSAKVRVVLSGVVGEDTLATDLANLLPTVCAQTTTTIAQADDPAVMDQSSGQAIAQLGVVDLFVGTRSTHPAMNYLLQHDSTVYDGAHDGDSYLAIRRRHDGHLLLTIDQATLDAHHSYFIIQTVRDAVTLGVSYMAYGLDFAGTKAAAWYTLNRAAPMRASFIGKSYYAVEWTDNDSNSAPNEGDFFTIQVHD